MFLGLDLQELPKFPAHTAAMSALVHEGTLSSAFSSQATLITWSGSTTVMKCFAAVTCMWWCMCVEVRGQSVGVMSLIPPHGTELQAWWQAPSLPMCLNGCQLLPLVCVSENSSSPLSKLAES